MEALYFKYCEDLGYHPYEVTQSCRNDQMMAYDWMMDRSQILLSDPNSEQSKKLAACILRFDNKANHIIDARMVKTCYTLP